MRNRILLTLLLCLLGSISWGQTVDSTSFYRQQLISLNKNYIDNPNDVESLLKLADFYSLPSNPMRNYPLATQYLVKATDLYRMMVANDDYYKQVTKLIRKNITLQTIKEQRLHIIDLTEQYLDTDPDMTEEEVDCYLAVFDNSATLSPKVRALKLRQAYRATKAKGDVDAYYNFARTYNGTQEADEANEIIARLLYTRMEQLNDDQAIDSLVARYPECEAAHNAAHKRKSNIAFQRAEKVGTMEAYKQYTKEFKAGDDYLTALDRIDSLLNLSYTALRTPQDYVDFIKANGESAISEHATQALRDMVTKEHRTDAARLYMDNFPLDLYYDPISREFYNWHSEEGNLTPIQKFADTYPKAPFKLMIRSDLEQGRRVDAFDLMRPYSPEYFDSYASFIRMNTGKGIAFVALQRILQNDRKNKNWKAALEHLDYFLLSFDVQNKDEYNDLRQLVSTKSTCVAQNELSPSFSITNPIPSPDGQTLYYCRDRAIHSAQFSAQNKARWIDNGALPFANPSDNSDITPFCLYDNGKKMLVGKNGDIYSISLIDSLWTLSDPLPHPVNTDAIETDAFMLADGSGLLLASDREGGENIQASGTLFHGDTALATDLYFIPRNGTRWGEPVRLGTAINSPYCERSPIVSHDGRYLFFISDGHGGFGYGDIYVAVRTGTAWNNWSKPINIGREVNSGFNESHIAFSNDESRIFFSANTQTGRYNCQTFATAPLLATITKDSTLQKQVAEAPTATAPSVWSYNDDKLTLRGYSDQTASQYIPLHRVVFNLSNNGQEYVTDNQELNLLADYLQQHPNLQTDIRTTFSGSDSKECFSRSRHRGQILKRYLIDHGIAAQRISVSAYGNAIRYEAAPPVSIRLSPQE